MKGLLDFILFVLEQEQEDTLWEIWLHKDIDKDFKSFKSQYAVKTRSKKVGSSQNEEKTIAYAQQFMKPRENINEKGGDD